MGIRVRKTLGYGLTDVRSKNYSITDERFLPDKHTDEPYYYDDARIEEFLNWVINNKEECISVVSSFLGAEYGYYSSIIGSILSNHKKEGRQWACPLDYCFEYGLKNVVVFTPLERPYWQRHDDTIDYMEETYLNGKKRQHTWCKELIGSCGIYPHVRMFLKPGRKTHEDLSSLTEYYCSSIKNKVLDPATYNMLVGQWCDGKKPLASGELLKHLLNDYMPHIPESVILFTYYFKIFKDWQETLSELKPVIYTHWG